MKTRVLPITGLLFVSALILAACNNNHDENFYGSGTLEATEVQISSQVNGMVMEMKVSQGDQVSAGQVIAVVDSERVHLKKQQLLAGIKELDLNTVNLRRSVELAAENLANTGKKFDRISALYKDGSTTQQNYDDIETALTAAKVQHQNAATSLQAVSAKKEQLLAQLGLVERELRDCCITSPVDGVVLVKLVDAGELVRAGSGIVTVADTRELKIKVYITEADLGRVRIGQSVSLVPGMEPAQSFDGKVVWVSPQAEFTPKNVQTRDARADLVYAVKISVDNPDGVLKIGMPAEAYLQ